MRRRLVGLIKNLVKRVQRSLRTQLILTFVFCLAFAAAIEIVIIQLLEDKFASRYVETYTGMKEMEHQTQHLAGVINRVQELYPLDPASQKSEIQNLLNDGERDTLAKTATFRIVDEKGEVMIRSENASRESVNLSDLLRRVMEQRNQTQFLDQTSAFVTLYPVEFVDKEAYLICTGIPREEVQQGEKFTEAGALLFVVIFLFLFYQITKRKTDYIEELSRELKVISQGKLGHRVRKKGEDELGILAHSINQMAEDLEAKIEEERKAERLKNELISNVSHDLRTPLTSIIGYLRLLHEGRAKTSEEQREYLRIAFGKSEQLQRLVEDLFEYTKLSHHDVRLAKQIVSLNELVGQISEEYVPLLEESELQLVSKLSERELSVDLDPEKMVRVFENLLINAIKYSHKPSVVELCLQEQDGGALLLLRNRGDDIAQEQLERLFERFYRLDQSRSTDSGGSGLGLAISKSIVDLHGGKIWATSNAGVITFYVWLPVAEPQAERQS